MIEIKIDKEALFSEAEGKLRRQKEFKKTIEQNADAAEELNDCLHEAREALFKVCDPRVAFTQLEASSDGVSVKIGDTYIENTPMAKSMDSDSQLIAYLLTLSYDSEKILQDLDNDYVIYHFQHILGREVLFALGRAVHRAYSNAFPTIRFKRHSIRMRKESLEETSNEEEVNYWDPEVVGQLVTYFNQDHLNVTVKESGCFSPLQTILGVMVGHTH